MRGGRSMKVCVNKRMPRRSECTHATLNLKDWVTVKREGKWAGKMSECQWMISDRILTDFSKSTSKTSPSKVQCFLIEHVTDSVDTAANIQKFGFLCPLERKPKRFWKVNLVRNSSPHAKFWARPSKRLGDWEERPEKKGESWGKFGLHCCNIFIYWSLQSLHVLVSKTFMEWDDTERGVRLRRLGRVRKRQSQRAELRSRKKICVLRNYQIISVGETLMGVAVRLNCPILQRTPLFALARCIIFWGSSGLRQGLWPVAAPIFCWCWTDDIWFVGSLSRIKKPTTIVPIGTWHLHWI